jgi:hypothetical protein
MQKNQLLAELMQMRSSAGFLSSGSMQEVLSDGTVVDVPQTAGGGVQRSFIPYTFVRTGKPSTNSPSEGGGWAEYGPLFDGIKWNDEKCRTVPSICHAIRSKAYSLCSGKGNYEPDDVSRKCGSDTVVTIVRLKPGTQVLPHCGTTNRRLILHWCLEGCDGIEYAVGGVTKQNYGGDGSPIIFDDSFEYSIKHNGSKDMYMVLAVLAHPAAH